MIDVLEFFEAATQYELLKRFEPRHLEKLAGLAREAEFQTGQIIVRQGENAGFFHLIVHGSVCLQADSNGTVQVLHAGDALGWSAVTNASAHFDARAAEPVRTISFDGAQLRAACESDPSFGYAMMKALLDLASERLDAARIRMSSGS